MTTRIAVISDTHLPRGRRALPPECRERLAAADLVIHAGDVVTADVLAEIGAMAPRLVAVAGNADDHAVRAALPRTAEVAVDGARIGVVHDGGPSAGRLERLRGRFPDCDLVVFGHSHIPLHEVAPDGFAILNPGSPTDRRRQPRHTMGEILVAAGRVAVTILTLTEPADPSGP